MEIAYLREIYFTGISCLLLFNAALVFPESDQPSEAKATPVGVGSSIEGKATQFGGPSSVGGTLDTDKQAEGAVTYGEEQTRDYFSYKQKIQKDYGLAFGFDYNALYQASTDSLGEDEAASGALRIFGHWTLVNRDADDKGMVVFKVEHRHRIGTDIAPQDLGFETGYIGVTAVPFSDMGWALTNLYWYQHFLENRVAFVAGVVDCTDYLDVYGLVNPWTTFANLAFSTSPTIPAPNQGLGAAMSLLTTENLYILGGLADANGDPTDPGELFDSFFDDAEYFSHVEIGWISSYEKRFSDNIHLTVWHADERDHANVSDGWGAAFSLSRLMADRWEPFFRAGYAHDGGALWKRSISIGTGYYTRKKNDLIGLGLNWGRPSEDTLGPGLGDQYTMEVFYRFQLLKSLTITPDVQFLFDPSSNPDEDLITIWGLRARLAF